MARQRRLALAAAAQQALERRLAILQGTGRRPSAALTLLAGGLAPDSPAASLAPDPPPAGPGPRAGRVSPHTLYLAEEQLRDLDVLARAWGPSATRRLSRSAVARRAIAHLRRVVEAGEVGVPTAGRATF